MVRRPVLQQLDFMEGWVSKASARFPFGVRWDQFYAQLRGKSLHLFDSQEDVIPLGSINFDMMTVEVWVINHDQIEIKPKGSQKPLKLRFADPSQLKLWAVALYNVIKESLGSTMELSVKTDLYLYENIISQTDFFNIVDT